MALFQDYTGSPDWAENDFDHSTLSLAGRSPRFKVDGFSNFWRLEFVTILVSNGRYDLHSGIQFLHFSWYSRRPSDIVIRVVDKVECKSEDGVKRRSIVTRLRLKPCGSWRTKETIQQPSMSRTLVSMSRTLVSMSRTLIPVSLTLISKSWENCSWSDGC